MTPYDLEISLHGYYRKKEREAEEYIVKYKQEHDDKIIQAYLISRWVWQKRVNLRKYIRGPVTNKNKQKMTNEEIYEQLKKMSALS